MDQLILILSGLLSLVVIIVFFVMALALKNISENLRTVTYLLLEQSKEKKKEEPIIYECPDCQTKFEEKLPNCPKCQREFSYD